MKNKFLLKWTYILFGILIFLLGIFLLCTRLFYGVWNPTAFPDRIDYLGHRFYASNLPPTYLNSHHNLQLIKSQHIFMGKRIYTTTSLGNQPPVIIYFQAEDDELYSYTISGSQ